MKMKLQRLGSFLLMGFLLANFSCSFGPHLLEQGHLGYNEAVKTTADQELLLNIVRLRYLDTIEFLTSAEMAGLSRASLYVALSRRSWKAYGRIYLNPAGQQPQT